MVSGSIHQIQILVKLLQLLRSRSQMFSIFIVFTWNDKSVVTVFVFG